MTQDTAWAEISLSDMHACGLTASGSSACWGSNASGQLGQAIGGPETCPGWRTMVGCSARPSFTPSVPRLRSVVAAGRYSCGITEEGAGLCWGAGDPEPVALINARSLRQLSGSSELLCGLDTRGVIACWEFDGYAGPLGDRPPTTIRGPEAFAAVAAGQRHVCAVGESGAAYCWGENSAGQLGVGDFVRRDDPTPVAGDRRFTQLSAARGHTCGRTRNGEVYCWGQNRHAQLGAATPRTCYTEVNYPNYCPSALPLLAVQGTGFRSVAAGEEHTCAADLRGRVVCWGTNRGGALGVTDVPNRCGLGRTGSDPCTLAHVRVETGVRFVALKAGMEFTCGITERRDAFCWGSNYLGKLGAPSVEVGANRSVFGSVEPVRVANP